MLNSLEIVNVKGIARRQRIDFRPLTLLFGANSAGKSTIIQTLLYLHELLERGSADVDRTDLGGDVLELGGFARLVHRHEIDRRVVLRAEFETPGSLERFGRDLADFPFPDLDDQVESAWLELTVRFRRTPTFRGPVVDRAVIGVNGDTTPLVSLDIGTSLREGDPLQARINLGHPLLATEVDDSAIAGGVGRQLPLLDAGRGAQLPLDTRQPPAAVVEQWEQIAIPKAIERESKAEEEPRDEERGDRPDPQEVWAKADPRLSPAFALFRSRLSALPPVNDPLRVISVGDESLKKTLIAAQVRTFLEMIVLGTTSQLESFLRDAIYIGPLRAVPSRGFLYQHTGRITTWADGLAGWDLLLADRLNLVAETNRWLRRLGTGCQIVVQQLFDPDAEAEELTDDHVDKSVRRLLLDTGAGSRVLPSEVGAGVSQIIPVVVAALEGRAGLTLVEQPEIHVHPAVQVGLGDLLIDAITREGNRRMLLVETHSEHLILRLLRRIRETTDKELPEGAPPFSEDNLSVIHVENLAEGVRIQRLRVDEYGEFSDRWPHGFFEERADELF
jgi:hypothetical protein